ncbi:sigma-70 family RNA polymerase sigma factor [Herbiconiux sp. 11R-BC]|uniref:RNA polymerase sigma factor n=1 Tax=Herbiconiux sp. 11R-BC TaxID=3111637 RepID=UPI003BFE7D17
MISSDPQRLRRRAISLGVHPEDADDIAQIAALRAWRSIDTLRSYDGGPLCAWLDVIARNTVIDAGRARSALVLAGLDETIADGVDVVADVEIRVALEHALDRIAALPDGLRVPFVLSVVDGRSAKEIAELTGLTPVNVRQRITRARQALSRDRS